MIVTATSALAQDMDAVVWIRPVMPLAPGVTDARETSAQEDADDDQIGSIGPWLNDILAGIGLISILAMICWLIIGVRCLLSRRGFH
jgi:hypothetical protein